MVAKCLRRVRVTIHFTVWHVRPEIYCGRSANSQVFRSSHVLFFDFPDCGMLLVQFFSRLFCVICALQIVFQIFSGSSQNTNLEHENLMLSRLIA